MFWQYRGNKLAQPSEISSGHFWWLPWTHFSGLPFCTHMSSFRKESITCHVISKCNNSQTPFKILYVLLTYKRMTLRIHTFSMLASSSKVEFIFLVGIWRCFQKFYPTWSQLLYYSMQPNTVKVNFAPKIWWQTL